jgi:hypothetical protein
MLKSLVYPSHYASVKPWENKRKGHFEIPEQTTNKLQIQHCLWTHCLQFVHIEPNLKLKNRTKLGSSEVKLESKYKDYKSLSNVTSK